MILPDSHFVKYTSGKDTAVIKMPSALVVPEPCPVYTCFVIQKLSVIVPYSPNVRYSVAPPAPSMPDMPIIYSVESVPAIIGKMI